MQNNNYEYNLFKNEIYFLIKKKKIKFLKKFFLKKNE